MKIELLLAAVLLASSGGKSLQVSTPDGIEILHYDVSRVPEKEIAEWVQFSENVIPYNYYLVPETLNLCIDQSPEYAPCGTRDINDPNFLRNATVNLQRIQQRIAKLNGNQHPADLRPIIAYIKRIQTDELAVQTSELKFLQDWNPNDLAITVDGCDLGRACSSSIARLATIPNRSEAFNLLNTAWFSCANQEIRKQAGEYPRDAWQRLLDRYSIREEFIPAEVQ